MRRKTDSGMPPAGMVSWLGCTEQMVRGSGGKAGLSLQPWIYGVWGGICLRSVWDREDRSQNCQRPYPGKRSRDDFTREDLWDIRRNTEAGAGACHGMYGAYCHRLLRGEGEMRSGGAAGIHRDLGQRQYHKECKERHRSPYRRASGHGSRGGGRCSLRSGGERAWGDFRGHEGTDPNAQGIHKGNELSGTCSGEQPYFGLKGVGAVRKPQRHGSYCGRAYQYSRNWKGRTAYLAQRGEPGPDTALRYGRRGRGQGGRCPWLWAPSDGGYICVCQWGGAFGGFGDSAETDRL